MFKCAPEGFDAGRSLFKRAVPLATVALLALVALSPAVLAVEDRMDVNVRTLQHVDVSIYSSVPGPAGDGLRTAVDGNEDGAVSGEEYAVYLSAVEMLVFAAPPTAIEAYSLIWNLENVTGADPFTPAGRFNLGTLVAAQAPAMQLAATMDGVPGEGRVTYLSMPGLAGDDHSNASVDVTLTVRFDWDPLSTYDTHKLQVQGPPLVALEVRLPGGLQPSGLLNVSKPSTTANGGVLMGTTTTAPVEVTLEPRGASITAVWMAVTMIVGALVVVGYGAVVVARQRAPGRSQGPARGTGK